MRDISPEHLEQLRTRIETLMRRIFSNVRPQIAEVRLLSELTMPQLKTMLLLHSEGPLRMSDLAARLGVGLPTATSLVTKLEDKGLAARQHTKEDRRVVLCSVTEAGLHEGERFWGVWRERVNAMVGVLTKDELELVIRAMELVARAGDLGQGTNQPSSSPVAPTRAVSTRDRQATALPGPR